MLSGTTPTMQYLYSLLRKTVDPPLIIFVVSTSLVEQRPYSLIKDRIASIPYYKTFAEFLDVMDTNPEEGENKQKRINILLTEPRERPDAEGINTFKLLSTNLQHPQTKSRAEKIIPLLPYMECRENIHTAGQFNAELADEGRLSKRKTMELNASKRRRISDLDGTERDILRPMVYPHDPEDTYLTWFYRIIKALRD
ncbi:uncharacterized protein EV154DRAFT_550694 [Mucor mucedo]|uniref:uncharacterized protein n=1 Tax=Mucor mucedo TaxID=29922 RepID=UPI00221F0B2C|nr:uncharacterized protein EV154DRAFT_550694 [Mucor mucedo]KAI7892542.1 hypothetical protein EV154DRAFT_550694 [Mucor mucedo]